MKEDARLLIVHVLEWSPYSFLTTEELVERHKTRQQELARANETILKPILENARQAGATADGEVRYGHVVDLICSEAKEQNATMIFVGGRVRTARACLEAPHRVWRKSHPFRPSSFPDN